MAFNPRISVILVNYNTKALTIRAIKELLIQTVHEIIVVDNASQDGTGDAIKSEFPTVTLIENEINKGFGAANNQGLAVMSGDLAFLLNSDAFPLPNAVQILATVFSNEKIIAAGGKLVNPDNSLQESACSNLTLWAVLCEQLLLEKAFKNSQLFSPYWQSKRLQQLGPGPHHVAQVMGACLMFRPKEVFDERFFLYCEDTELCVRLAKHGSIVYFPEAAFQHDLGASSHTNKWAAVARYNRGKELFFNIHKGSLSALLCWILNRLGALLRLFIWVIPTVFTLGLHAKFRNQTILWIKVLFAGFNGPPLPPDTQPKLRPEVRSS